MVLFVGINRLSGCSLSHSLNQLSFHIQGYFSLGDREEKNLYLDFEKEKLPGIQWEMNI